MLRHRNVIFLITGILSSCTNSVEIPNTPTTGSIRVLADHTFSYIVPPQLNLFSSIYKNTEVSFDYKGERECIDALLKNECKLILISRRLSEGELKTFETKNLIVQQTPLAYTAIAILGKPFRDKGLTLNQLKSILSGKTNISVVFFGDANGAVLYCKDSVLEGNSFGKNCFRLNDSAQFRNYLLRHDSVIGIIDYTLICDDDDKWTYQLKYFPDTMIIPIRKNEQTPAYYPDQSNIATRDYPLVRTIYCIRRGDNFSLSAGIEAFLAGEKGQILFKKMGLVPVIDRERRIEIHPY